MQHRWEVCNLHMPPRELIDKRLAEWAAAHHSFFGKQRRQDDDGDASAEKKCRHGDEEKLKLAFSSTAAQRLQMVPASVNTPEQNAQLRAWVAQLCVLRNTAGIVAGILEFKGNIDVAVHSDIGYQLPGGRGLRSVTLLCAALYTRNVGVLRALAARGANPNACGDIELPGALGVASFDDIMDVKCWSIHPVPAAFVLRLRSGEDTTTFVAFVAEVRRLFPAMDFDVELVHAVARGRVCLPQRGAKPAPWWECKPVSAVLVDAHLYRQPLLCWVLECETTRALVVPFLLRQGADPLRPCSVAPYHTPFDCAQLLGCAHLFGCSKLSERYAFLRVFNRTTLPADAAVRVCSTPDGLRVDVTTDEDGVAGGLLPTTDAVLAPLAVPVQAFPECSAAFRGYQDVIEAVAQAARWAEWCATDACKQLRVLEPTKKQLQAVELAKHVNFVRTALVVFGIPQRRAHADRVHEWAAAHNAATTRRKRLRLEHQASLLRTFSAEFCALVASGQLGAADALSAAHDKQRLLVPLVDDEVGVVVAETTKPVLEHMTEYCFMIAGFLQGAC